MKKLPFGFTVLLLSACGGDSTSGPIPSRVYVSPISTTLEAVGETRQYTARVIDTGGDKMVGVPVTWTSSDPQVASIDATGLATALTSGTTIIRATAEGLSGTGALNVNLVPRELLKVSGDAQTGFIHQNLPEDLTVEVRDVNGNPIEGAMVTFEVQAGGGMVSKGLVQTGPDGRASSAWRLGCSNENPQRLEAFVPGLNVSFTATADLAQLVICGGALPGGRVTHLYSAQMKAAGGSHGILSWDLEPGMGFLPAGLTLTLDGRLSGTPAQEGTFSFRARVEDGMGNSASSPFSIRVCEAPLSLPPGGIQVLSTTGPDDCGFFLPAGVSGDRYRIGLVYAASGSDSLDIAGVTVSIEEKVGAGAQSPRARRASPLPSPFLLPGARQTVQVSGPLQEALDADAATEAFHRRLRIAERELFRRLGPDVRLLPDRRGSSRALAGAPGAPPAPAPEKRTFTHGSEDFTSCAVSETVRGVKIAENDLMVFYQDSVQHAFSPVSLVHVQSMLDYYQDYGNQVIEGYFGGVTDINADGRIVVLVTPEVGSGLVAFVWSADFLSRKGSCPASNEMELVRFNQSTIQGMSRGNYQALGSLVHEVKHLSSLYNSQIVRGLFQPDWVEEGTAEIAGELSSRLAWAATGGPAVGAKVGFGEWSGVTPENWGVALKLVRTVHYLGSQPNGVVETPVGSVGISQRLRIRVALSPVARRRLRRCFHPPCRRPPLQCAQWPLLTCGGGRSGGGYGNALARPAGGIRRGHHVDRDPGPPGAAGIFHLRFPGRHRRHEPDVHLLGQEV